MWASIITAIAGAITTSWKNYQERKQVEHQTNLAIEIGKQKIIEQQLANEHELNTVRLKSTGKWFKYFTFIMWFGPFMISWVFPGYGKQIFDNLKILPAWYVQSCMTIMFTVWSISVSSDTIQTIFRNLGKYMSVRQEIKLRRKLFYDTLRSTKGPIGQHEVNALEHALDAIEGSLKDDTKN